MEVPKQAHDEQDSNHIGKKRSDHVKKKDVPVPEGYDEQLPVFFHVPRGSTVIGGLIERPDDFFERRLSDGKIFDFSGRVYPFEGVFYGFGRIGDLDDEKVAFAAFEFMGFRDELAFCEAEPNRFLFYVFLFQGIKRSVGNDFAVIDDDYPIANVFDVADIVGSKEDGRSRIAVDLIDDVAEFLLGDHVETDGRFVQEKDLGVMDEARGDFGAHALAKGKLSDRRRVEVADFEGRNEKIDPRFRNGIGQLVELGKELERITWR